MKVRKVNRYYCDYCKKANCSKSSISKHESHCTLNPNRECGMCRLLKEKQPNLQELILCIPQINKYRPEEDYLNIEECKQEILDKGIIKTLKEKSNNCPACIMAALRQAKIPIYLTDFDYKKECDDIFTELREECVRQEEERTYY
jgi:hypothetical protein